MSILDPRLFDADSSWAGGLLGHLAPIARYGGGLRAGEDFARWPAEHTQRLAGMVPEPLETRAPVTVEGGGFFGPLGHWLGDNSSALIGLGGGLAGGRSWSQGLGRGLELALSGRALDRQRAARNETVATLTRLGMNADTARAAAGNPTLLRALLARLAK